MKRRRGYIIGLIAAFSFSVASCVDDPALSSQEETIESSLSSSSKRSSSRTVEQTSIDPIALLNFELNEDGESYSVSAKGDIIRELKIPSTYNGLPVTSISRLGFDYCNNLKKIEMPDTITSVGESAFIGCKSLEEVTLSKNLLSLSKSMFYNCQSLTSIDIPSGITSIENQCFYQCYELKSITIASTVTSIGEEAFYNDYNLQTLNIPNGTISIADKAFYGCSGLVSTILGETLSSIGEAAFGGCYRLVEVVNKSSLPLEAGSYDYGGVAFMAKEVVSDESHMRVSFGLLKDMITYNERGFLWLVSYDGLIKDRITIPNGIKGINDHCFNASYPSPLSVLTEVHIPDSVSIIGSSSFYDCESLSQINFPRSLTSIGKSAFHGCKTLTELTLPTGLTSIGDYAFSYCQHLRVITLPNTLTSIGEYVFQHSSDLEIINYQGTIEEWEAVEKATNWYWLAGSRAQTVACTNGSVPVVPPPADSSSQN